MQNGNYIKLGRTLLEWEWYLDINTCRLFIHFLLKANWKDGKFKGVEVPRGSFVSSLNILSQETRLTVDEIRTAICHMKRTGEITSKSHSKFTVFTVLHYDLYQEMPKQNPNEIPSTSHSIPTLFPTIEERKNINTVYACEKFEVFWSAYPKKAGRILAEQAYVGSTQSGMEEGILIQAASNYAESCKIKNTKEQFIKSPANWINDGTWVDYAPDNYSKPVTQKAKKADNKFINSNQREYDYGELEKKLLGVRK